MLIQDIVITMLATPVVVFLPTLSMIEAGCSREAVRRTIVRIMILLFVVVAAANLAILRWTYIPSLEEQLDSIHKSEHNTKHDTKHEAAMQEVAI